jgi:hypothetical protein
MRTRWIAAIFCVLAGARAALAEEQKPVATSTVAASLGLTDQELELARYLELLQNLELLESIDVLELLPMLEEDE